METSLIGQYLVSGYGTLDYLEIVAAYTYRGTLMLVAKSDDGRLLTYDVDAFRVVKEIPSE